MSLGHRLAENLRRRCPHHAPNFVLHLIITRNPVDASPSASAGEWRRAWRRLPKPCSRLSRLSTDACVGASCDPHRGLGQAFVMSPFHPLRTLADPVTMVFPAVVDPDNCVCAQGVAEGTKSSLTGGSLCSASLPRSWLQLRRQPD